jgi:hypothetical protein
MPLIDDTDFKTREESVTYDQAGLDLLWNFTTTAGAFTQTAVTPTDTGGAYDWVNQGNGYYTIEIPASGGASINNDTEGFGFFSGFATGILPWRGPVIGFRAAALNNSFIDGATVDVNVTAIAAGAITAAAIATGAIDADAIAADAIGASEIAADAGVEIAAAVWDRVLSAANHNIANSAGRRLRQLQDVGGYAEGAIWIDTVAGTAGTTEYENGTVNNPVDSIADALTLAAATKIRRFHVAAGSSITLAAAFERYEMDGQLYTVALGGQSIAGSEFQGATVSGTGTGAATFMDCHLAAGATMGPAEFFRCGFAGTSESKVTAGSAGDFFLIDCYSEVAGSGTPYFSFPGACGVNIRRWSGGSNITLDDATATLTMEVVTGGGQTIATAGASVELRGICRSVTLTGIASGATCQINAVTGPISLAGADGTVNIYGVCGTVTDSRTGTPVLSNAADLSTDINEILTDTGTTIPGTITTMQGNVTSILADTNELQTDWADGGRLDTILDAAGSAGDPWSTAVPGAYASGTAGYVIGTDIPTRITALGSGTVTISSPVASDGTITIYQGDDYSASDSRQISFTVSVSGNPSLTGATCKLKLHQATWTASSCTSDGTDWTIVFQPTAAQTTALTATSQPFELEATLSSTRVVTLETGTCNLVKDIPVVS